MAQIEMSRTLSAAWRYDHGMTTKITVSLPDYQVQEAKRAVAEGRAESVSGYVSAALLEYGTGGIDELLAYWDQKFGPPSPEATTWARKALGLDEE